MRTAARALPLLLATALVAGACADDDGDGADATTAPTEEPSSPTIDASTVPVGTDGSAATTPPTVAAPTTEAPASTAAPSTTAALVDPYDGHRSAVYDDGANWMCRPDLADDECDELDTTVVAADGTASAEDRTPTAHPPIDCFYVYPTTSLDAGASSDLVWTPTDNEPLTVRAQAAPYAESCRVYAPVYRQITLGGLGNATEADRERAYADVLDAWQTYVSQWNDGRGVILIGHSQGTGHLVRLIQEQIDDRPELRDRLVSTHLFGGSITAPAGEVVGGTFSQIPACTTADEIGCVVFWSSYPAEPPVAADAIFSRDGDDGPALCVDPAELLGREHVSPLISTRSPNFMTVAPDVAGAGTSYVAWPDALDVSCQSANGHTYLGAAAADPADARDVSPLLIELLGPTWGLHIVDMTIALDDLVELAHRQGDAYVAAD